eukprot:262838-Prymnesium_polylepis.1
MATIASGVDDPDASPSVIVANLDLQQVRQYILDLVQGKWPKRRLKRLATAPDPSSGFVNCTFCR